MKKTIPALCVLVLFITLAASAIVQAASRDIGAIYHSYDQTYSILKQLAAAHPNEMSYEVIGKSLLGKDILMFKVGNPNGGKFMFDGLLHGSEDGGTESGMAFIKWVLESSDPDAIRVRKNNYLLFIPIINIDSSGYRPNMRRSYTLANGSILKVTYGVDLNRNFPTGWGGSGTSDPNDNYDYRGLSAGSEPETKAVVNAMKKYKPSIYLNVHTGGADRLNYRTTNITTKILNLIKDISAKTGADTWSHYSPGPGCGNAGGHACGEGASWSGGNGWMLETSLWDNLPPTLDEYLQKIYPRVFPIYLAMAQAVEKSDQPTNITNPFCGDGTCNGKENCTTCSKDCGTCTITPPPTNPVCGDGTCNGKENCTTCSKDCGTCPAPSTKITACVLSSKSWNEDSSLKKAYNLSSCFKDPLGTKLGFSAKGQSFINVSITKGIVDLSAPIDWNGFETVTFYAWSGNRSASTNKVTLTVNPLADCGNGVCESGETCNECSADCGVCPPSGGGGGGGGSFDNSPNWVCQDWSECIDSEQTQTCTDTTNNVERTDTQTCETEPVPNWVCEGWSECIDSEQTQTCNDITNHVQRTDTQTCEMPITEPVVAASEPVIDPVVIAHSSGSSSHSSSSDNLPVIEEKSTNITVLKENNFEAVGKETTKVQESVNQIAVSKDTTKTPKYKFIAGFIVIIIVAGLAFAELKKKDKANQKNSKTRDYNKELNDYVVKAANRGFSKDYVKTKLINVGWSNDVVEGVIARNSSEFISGTNEAVFTTA